MYIHGKAKEHYKLIVGHGDTSMIVDTASKEFFSEEEREAYMDYMQGADVRELEAQEIIRGYFSSTYKDVDAIIKCNDIFFSGLYGIKQVFILGHSLADVDLPYFALLNSVLGQNVYWIVTYYREWEREEVIRRLSSVGISWHYIKMCRMEELEY